MLPAFHAWAAPVLFAHAAVIEAKNCTPATLRQDVSYLTMLIVPVLWLCRAVIAQSGRHRILLLLKMCACFAG